MKAGNGSRVLGLIQDLRECTRKLAESAKDPDADVLPLARLCRNSFEELTTIVPADWGRAVQTAIRTGSATESDRQIFEALAKLDSETQQCIQQIKSVRDEVEVELAALQQKRKAIRAYRGLT